MKIVTSLSFRGECREAIACPAQVTSGGVEIGLERGERLRQALEVRATLEPEIARRAAERATAADRERLRRLHRDLESARDLAAAMDLHAAETRQPLRAVLVHVDGDPRCQFRGAVQPFGHRAGKVGAVCVFQLQHQRPRAAGDFLAWLAGKAQSSSPSRPSLRSTCAAGCMVDTACL